MKLSIITICLNEVKNIEQTIQSVIKQTFTDYEYIVIDGGSEDGTVEKINLYKDNITKIISEKDKGIFDAQNKGVTFANGEYVIFLNSGDYFVNNQILERVFHKEIIDDVVYGDTLILHNGRLIRKPALNMVTPFYLYVDTIPHQNAFIKRELFKRIGLHDLSYKIAGDYEFFLRAFFKHGASAEYLPFPLAVNNLMGVSADPKNKSITYTERAKAQDNWFPKNKLKKYRMFNKLIYLFYKIPVYSWNILMSVMFKKYLKIENK